MVAVKAWTLDSTDDHLRLSDVPEPELRPGGVVLQVLGTQVPAYTRFLTTGGRGAIPTPTVLGAGGIGVVEAVADDVFNVRPGETVLATSLLPSGSAVEPEEVLIGWTGIGGRGEETTTTTRMRQVWRNGMFAEKALMPAATLVPLPGADRYPEPQKLPFLSWLGVAGGAVERAGIRAGQRVTVIGASGQMGGAAVLLALARGAGRVMAFGRNQGALERLAHADARVATVAASGDRVRDAAAITAVDGEVDVVIDALGPAPTADYTMAGYDALRPDGVMVVLGGVRQALSIPYHDLMRRRLTLRGSWMASPQVAFEVWRAVAAGAVNLSALTVRTVSLDDPETALDLAEQTSGLDIVALMP